MSSSLSFVGRMITIYSGIPLFIGGITGEILKMIVFSSLRTFRQSSCAFYLTVTSTMNIGQLSTGLLALITNTLFGVDGTESSLFYCKFRPYCFQTCALSSLGCFCLATFDQYCATCSHPRWQQWSNIKRAKRLVIINIIIWALHGIPYLIFFEQIQSSITGNVKCTSRDFIFAYYRSYVIIFILFGILPMSISTIFGLLAFRNVQELGYRTIPIVRRELDKQLTKMVLIQLIVNIFTLLPNTIISTVLTSPNIPSNTLNQTYIQFAYSIALLLNYAYFASSFYIYICASERFRRQFIHVLFTVHLERWRKPLPINNQVQPEF
ncbi:unnamed protein product [Adineta ricciae]|uniref:G-protein coupled receptors family 1 profile domain-containing protein n=1 Tax=Adineta ricciae TaxID=249248 RepID=A0A815Z9G0_ADIRI|nr:unnamed protein product [Adineta ricciae]CAF1579879.1 unnamed protein product [Adineta ricciae]